MRNILPKLRYICFIIVLNCLIVPLALRYWTCRVEQKRVFNEHDRKFTATFKARDILKQRKRSCRPKKNIVFLKTHKTGSSTVTNIFNRYGESRELTFVLPRMGENRLDWPWFFQQDSFYPLNDSEPNILCNHARYNKEAIKALMPNDTVYVTILRNPITQFESSFSYMTLDKILGMENSSHPIEEFFKDPEQVLVNYVLTQDLRINSDRLKLIRNGMFYDLGLESKEFENRLKWKEAINELDNQFDLVMLMEYFEESIVFLKRLLCWELDDVVYFRLKQRTLGWKQNISESLKRKISHWSNADTELYKHFNRTFWSVIKKLDSGFWDEVRMLKAKNNIMADLCLQKDRHVSSELIQTAETKQFKLRYNIPSVAREMCKRMTWDEIEYLKHLRQIHIDKVQRKYKTPESGILESLLWIANKFKRL